MSHLFFLSNVLFYCFHGTMAHHKFFTRCQSQTSFVFSGKRNFQLSSGFWNLFDNLPISRFNRQYTHLVLPQWASLEDAVLILFVISSKKIGKKENYILYGAKMVSSMSFDLTYATESYSAQPDVPSPNIELALSCSGLQHIKS